VSSFLGTSWGLFYGKVAVDCGEGEGVKALKG
jgi:hypothetical protein